MGSLLAAVGSWLDVRAAGGRWLLRIEDVDRERTVPGAEDSILRLLDACGLAWDGPVLRQSQRDEAYAAALERLLAQGDAYPCGCSRREIEQRSPGRAVDGAWLYPGTCREGLAEGRTARAWRLRVAAERLAFDDRVCGRSGQALADEAGDCVLRRADGIAAYQLAVVVDDAAQGVTDVVRGADLLDATPRQIYLQRCLGVPTPRYAHLPVLTNPAGEKLSKQTLAPAVEAGEVSAALTRVLVLLGHQPPAELKGAPPGELLAWAAGCWDIARVPKRQAIVIDEAGQPIPHPAGGSR